ncbi:chromosome segregation protein SMC (plasmid) [Halostagnicola larsenii XH-48]|uniref:Chromosome segregation protein SMC n=1 Tax=Halostagnicola larsenii XH-48 TaxID=797299 RepID=W0JY61_9EURY|nr:archaea-specific SMC-related protein [Halostagnicola larsenii]AHG02212.1 chromosome segregation protein SMC [Halostagnicola larsenii XH-48]
MSTAKSLESAIDLTAENIGGIDETAVTLHPGVNVLTGRNATNRTSFLQAIMAALGSEQSSLKGDANSGAVELTFADDQFTRSLYRQNGTVSFDGDPYLEDPELADLFAFLLESNEARRAVGRGDDLREIIMRPIDTDEIEAEISALETEKRELDERISELERLEDELPDLEAERVSIDEEIDRVSDQIDELETELEEHEINVDESRTRKAELETAFSELRSARKEFESVEYDLETERESLQELKRERDELEEEIDEHTAENAESPDRLDGRISELRERKRSLDSKLTELQNVIQFNETRLSGDGIDLEGELSAHDDSAELTDQLVEASDEIVCWTCGSNVERDRIESTLERLQSLHQETLTERNDVQNKIDELSRQKSAIKETAQRRSRLKRKRSSIEDEIEMREEQIDSLESERERLAERVEKLEADAESFEDTDYSDVLETHRELNRVELELEELESDRANVDERIEELESTIEDRDELGDRRAEIEDELTDLRTRVDRIEADAIDAFNDHMESILAVLEYGNIDRIWIERRETSVREGRRTVSKTAFDLHVVRTTDDGATYEDTISHLSESEREVTGLVFALAGYLVHNVYEVVPFMLLDSLEAIDSDRIASVVEYFEEYVDCLVVALLPEDAEPLPESHHYVTEI